MKLIRNCSFTVGICVLFLLQNNVYAQSKAGLPMLNSTNIRQVISLMTIEEKALLVRGANSDGTLPAGFSNAIPRLGIPAMVLTDGPAGVRITSKIANDPNTYYCTAFPIETLLASTWDRDMLYKVGKAMGNETLEYGADILLAPALNIHRNPLGGRNFEYYSEDPLISGKMAVAMVNGIQSEGVGASIKHFAANNQETNRFKINSIISERAVRELYLQGFKIALQESKPWTVMSSYNKINGVYTSEREDLLTTILRKEWGFGGFVMSDWRGGNDAVAQMKAGNDLLMPGKIWQSKSIDSALRIKALDMAIIDNNIERILKIVVQSPTFKKYNYSNKPDLKSHAQISRQAATAGMVLLKNDGQTLPIKKELKKVALFGKTSYRLIAGGTGSGEVNKAYVVSFEKGLTEAGYEVSASLTSKYREAITKAEAARKTPKEMVPELKLEQEIINQQAKETAVAIVTLGRISGESNDRKPEDFSLTATEMELLQAVSAAYHKEHKKVVVVLNVGGVVETDSWKNLADAILLAWQPGQEAGFAIADILSGKVNPSGKLATTFPVKYSDVPSAKNFPGTPDGKTDEVIHQEGIYVGYRYYDTFHVKPSYAFGHGLSYTNFSYGKAQLSSTIFDQNIKLEVEVKNTGAVAGKEIVELYLSCPSTILDKPLKELKAFAKTSLLQPGVSEKVVFMIEPQMLASFDPAVSAWVADAGKYTVQLGASSADIRQTVSFSLKAQLLVEKVNKALTPQVIIPDYKP